MALDLELIEQLRTDLSNPFDTEDALRRHLRDNLDEIIAMARSSADLLRLAASCYEDTKGLRLYSTQESDRYWEFAEAVMQRIAEARREPLDRRHEDDYAGDFAGEEVSQRNISSADAAKGLTFATEFNALAERHKVRACCITLVPSVTVPGAVSIQICGEVTACKIVESKLRGNESTYMGDHS